MDTQERGSPSQIERTHGASQALNSPVDPHELDAEGFAASGAQQLGPRLAESRPQHQIERLSEGIAAHRLPELVAMLISLRKAPQER